MYRSWAALKLNVSIYRYHIAAGAATYWLAPQVLGFFESKRIQDKLIEERQAMKRAGLYHH